MEHHRKLERMYAAAPINRFYRPTLRVDEARAVVSIDVTEAHHHSAGGMHGSVYFKVLDDAAWFACASLVEDVFVLTATFELVLLQPFTTGTVRAVGVVDERGHRLRASAELFDEQDRLLARGRGTFARSSGLLSSEVHYR